MITHSETDMVKKKKTQVLWIQ